MRRNALSLLRTAVRSIADESLSAKTTTAAGCLAIRRGFADDANLLKTPLYDFHIAHGGKRSRPRIRPHLAVLHLQHFRRLCSWLDTANSIQLTQPFLFLS